MLSKGDREKLEDYRDPSTFYTFPVEHGLSVFGV